MLPCFDTAWTYLRKSGTYNRTRLALGCQELFQNRNPVTHLIFIGRQQGLRFCVKSILEDPEQEIDISDEYANDVKVGGE